MSDITMSESTLRVPGLIPPVPHAFGFTEEHELARQQAKRFLADNCPSEKVRALIDDPVGYDKQLHARMLELGWLGLITAERHGGVELDHLHLVLLLEEMGARLLPSPFLGCLLAMEAMAISRHEAHAGRWVPEILSGEMVSTFAWGEPDGAWGPEQVSCRAKPVDGAWVLDGVKAHVLFGSSADQVVIPAVDHKEALGLFVIDLPGAGIEVEAEDNVDPTRRTARMVLDRCRVQHDRRLQGNCKEIYERVCALGQLALAAEMTGAAEAVLQATVQYAKDRTQFNKPIGAFQAVKHPLVNVMIGVEQCRSLNLGAACALSRVPSTRDPAPALLAASMAKAKASDVLGFAVKKGVQLHGGFGFTWDCDVQLYFKRMLWSRPTLGDAEYHRQALANTLFPG